MARRSRHNEGSCIDAACWQLAFAELFAEPLDVLHTAQQARSRCDGICGRQQSAEIGTELQDRDRLAKRHVTLPGPHDDSSCGMAKPLRSGRVSGCLCAAQLHCRCGIPHQQPTAVTFQKPRQSQVELLNKYCTLTEQMDIRIINHAVAGSGPRAISYVQPNISRSSYELVSL